MARPSKYSAEFRSDAIALWRTSAGRRWFKDAQVPAGFINQRVLGIARQGHPPGGDRVGGLFGLGGGHALVPFLVLTGLGESRPPDFVTAGGVAAVALRQDDLQAEERS
ncbi:hypothetical protein ACFVYE_46490 [Streptomyces sp. NPDC058239]|uniref:hypothetical protein n=1 Tax=Streptomyces sp. NPDC058239 TaxID=3346395 RepID=UPI0036E720BF